ncbi:MAG: methyl-accepting chemotaxis protein [Deltaproteobacteria bacterium]|nr:methyl-accepting chemotaxis protein [Deltaproteobacteria bacterium]
MNALWNMYLNCSIKFRLSTLCFCYSLCILAAGFTAQFESPLIKYGSTPLFIILGAIFGWINIWSINRPIQRAIAYLQTMAGGDLSEEITILRRNEFSKMLSAMKELQGSMRSMIAGIQGTAGHLTSASELLSTTSAQIADGTGNASSQSVAITTAVDEMASVSATISHSCQEMADKASGTNSATKSGEATISSMTSMMGEIERMVIGTMEAVKALGANSERIGDIVVAIGDIADQTNLLALNAAIEAARAGDQGRGFAVVADEVRSLAERTTKATREVQSIIASLQGDVKNVVTSMEQSANSVRSGTKDVQLSSQAIGAIKAHIAPLIEHVSQVATAAEEQSATSMNITESMRRISDVINDAANGAQRTEQAAAELSRSATELQQMVNRFKLA